MRRLLLVMFLGAPGSGKSYFARQLATRIDAVRLNGDSMRLALFGSVEEVERRHDDPVTNRMTFGAIDYAVDQTLIAGHDVVYDAHHNKRGIRKNLERMAASRGAIPLVVWIKTPKSVAYKRAQEREVKVDQLRLSAEKIREITHRQMANFNEPDEKENVIVIDGTTTFDQQLTGHSLAGQSRYCHALPHHQSHQTCCAPSQEANLLAPPGLRTTTAGLRPAVMG